jgi:hypothetical protein
VMVMMMIMEVLQVWEEYEEEEKVELVKVMVMMTIMEVLQVWEEYEEEEKVELVKELSAWKQRYLQPSLKRKSVSTALYNVHMLSMLFKVLQVDMHEQLLLS